MEEDSLCPFSQVTISKRSAEVGAGPDRYDLQGRIVDAPVLLVSCFQFLVKPLPGVLLPLVCLV